MLDKSFIEKICQLSKDQIVTVEDRKFSTDTLHPVKESVVAQIEIGSLTGIVDYLTCNPDALDRTKMFIHVDSPTSVKVRSDVFGPYRQREFFISAEYSGVEINLNRFCDIEEFLIMLKSKFDETEQRDKLIALLGNVSDENVLNLSDDGISQQVSVKKGVSLKDREKVPVIVKLRPYRTFNEIEQPEGLFMIRLRKGHEGELPQAAIFEADGRRWKNDAVLKIKEYLKGQLPRHNVIA